MGWATPSLAEVEDSIVRSVLTKEELAMLNIVKTAVSISPLYDKSSDNLAVRDKYTLNLFYNSYDSRYYFTLYTNTHTLGLSCTFLARNLSSIKNAIKECVPNIQEKYNKIEQDRLHRINTKEQEEKCKVSLWKKFNQNK